MLLNYAILLFPPSRVLLKTLSYFLGTAVTLLALSPFSLRNTHFMNAGISKIELDLI